MAQPTRRAANPRARQQQAVAQYRASKKREAKASHIPPVSLPQSADPNRVVPQPQKGNFSGLYDRDPEFYGRLNKDYNDLGEPEDRPKQKKPKGKGSCCVVM